MKMSLKILLEITINKNLVQGRGELWYAKLSLVLNTVLNFIEKVYLIGG